MLKQNKVNRPRDTKLNKTILSIMLISAFATVSVNHFEHLPVIADFSDFFYDIGYAVGSGIREFWGQL